MKCCKDSKEFTHNLGRATITTCNGKAIEMLARAYGVHLIAASTRQQYAFAVPELGHGVLTYVLLSGLVETGAPLALTSSDGWVTVYSLMLP